MTRKVKGPVVLVVLDGWGLREEKTHNGIAMANTPWYDHLVSTYPFTKLHASGEHVGLPNGQMGNSEVGHTTIGIGYVLYQDLVRITNDAKSGAFTTNRAFVQAFDHVKKNNSQLHVIGMFSGGGVHSHEDHFLEVIHAAKKSGVNKIILHPFLDGRDTPQDAGLASLKKLEARISSIKGCAIGSVAGRYFAMDRDTNWERTNKAFDAIFHGKADHLYDHTVTPSHVIEEWYHKDIFDEFLEPMVFTTQDGPLQVKTGDSIIFTNFRKDRAKQLSKKISENKEDKNLCFVTMTRYGSEIDALVAYTPESIAQTLAGVISDAGMHQAHVAETEKFPHATYYINGGRQEPYPNEEDVLLPSRKDIKTHDEAPEMKAKEICDAAIERLANNDFLFINFANPDMVGHTANEKAIIKAIEVVDRELKKLTEATLKKHGALLIIADHGNAEVMVDPVTQAPHTSHTTNMVPCILVHETYHPILKGNEEGLKDVAPTILDLLGLPKPKSMTGESLFT